MADAHAKRRDIEGLRAIAVVLVLLFHAQLSWAGGGFLGVDVFFVLSGFLITRSLAVEAGREGTIRLARFYARRARRLLPAAAVVLAATAAAVRTLLPPTMWEDFGGDIAASAAYVVNWRFASRSVDYLAEDVLPSPVQHFWSLAIEEQFYLVWPLLLLAVTIVARRRGWQLRRALLWALVVVVAVPSLLWSITSTADQQAIAFFDTRTRMWELAAGGIVALAPPFPGRGTRTATMVKAASVALLVGGAVVVDASTAWPGWAAVVAVGPTAVLLGLGGAGDDVVERVLSRPTMQRLGAWSYSLYLWHWPPLAVLAARSGELTVAEASIVVIASFAPAIASYHLLENPVRFAPRLVSSNGFSLSVGANLTLVGVLAGGFVWLGGGGAGGGDGPDTLALDPPGPPAAQQPTAPATAPDGPDGPDTPAQPATPTPSPTTSAPPVEGPSPVEGPVGAGVLDPAWDDRTVLQLLDVATSITPTPTGATDDLPRVYEDACHVPVTVADLRVCEYGDEDGDVHVALVGDSKAGQWGDALETIGTAEGWRLTYLLKSGCELSAAVPDIGDEPNPTCDDWNEQVMDRLTADPPDVVVTSQVSQSAWTEDGEDRLDALVEGMVEAYDVLEAAGSEVVVLMDNHSPRGRLYECVAENLDDLGACAFDRVDRTGGRPAQRAAAERGGYDVIDMADLVCPTPTCLPVIGNVLVYRQGSHLTATYVDTMTPALALRLAAVVDGSGAATATGG